MDLCKMAIWERKYYWARRRNVGDKFQLLVVSQNNSARRKWRNFTFCILEALPKAEPTKIPPSLLEVSNRDSKGTVIKLWFGKTWLFSIFYSHILSRNRTSVRKVVVHTDLQFFTENVKKNAAISANFTCICLLSPTTDNSSSCNKCIQCVHFTYVSLWAFHLNLYCL